MNHNFIIIAGPCVIESKDICFEVADTLKEIFSDYPVDFYFKASYKKANRTRVDSFTGPGVHEGLAVLKSVSEHTGCKTVTDVHETQDVSLVSQFVDVIQIPAFLCRQTDLLMAAGNSQKIVNIKKGQFLSPASMKFAADKVKSTGNEKIWITERGTTFGYHDLIVDFRGIPVMKKMGYPVILDITHSLQQPNQETGVTGGLPELIETMALCGIAAGVTGIFFETHPNPSKSLSDGANMLPLKNVALMIERTMHLYDSVKRMSGNYQQ